MENRNASFTRITEPLHWQPCHAPTVSLVTPLIPSIFPIASPAITALALIRRRIPARREPRYTTRLDLSSALFGSLCEKRLELRHNLGAVAVRALNALLFVLTDRHRKGETLVTLLAKIFVERLMNLPQLFEPIWLRPLDIIVPR